MHPLAPAIGSFIATVLVGGFLHFRYLSQMRRRFPRPWEALGKPTGMQDIFLLDAFHHVRWLWRKRYEQAEDPEFERFCASYRWWLILIYLFQWGALFYLFYQCRYLLPSFSAA